VRLFHWCLEDCSWYQLSPLTASASTQASCQAGIVIREPVIGTYDRPKIEVSMHALMTVKAFMQSYDRDILDLQDDPSSYIEVIEGELEACYPMAHAFDNKGNKVWSIGVLREHLSIMGEPLWENEQLAI